MLVVRDANLEFFQIIEQTTKNHQPLPMIRVSVQGRIFPLLIPTYSHQNRKTPKLLKVHRDLMALGNH